MALDTRRAYHHKNDATSMHISANTLPAMIIIAIGLILLILCIILMAAFGLPTKVNEKPEQLSGPLCAAGGIIFCFIGGLYASKLKKDRQRRAKQQRVRPSQNNGGGYANRAYAGTTTNNSGGVYTTQQHHPQYYHSQQQPQPHRQQQHKKSRNPQHHQHQHHHYQQQQQQQYHQPQYPSQQQYPRYPQESKEALYGYSATGRVDSGTPTSIGHK